MIYKNTFNRCCIDQKSCISEVTYMSSVHIWSPSSSMQRTHSDFCRHLQRRPDTDSQQTSAEGKLLSSCLCSAHPTTFIISSSLRTLQSSITSASSFALLVFGTDLTTALQCRQRCISTCSFFLPTYKVSNPKASLFTVHEQE